MASWRRLVFATPHDLQETLIVCLHELGSLGTQTEDDQVIGWFDDGVDEKRLLQEIAALLASDDARLVGSETVPDGRWHERWMERLAPLPIGDRFLVVPGPVTPRD